MRSFRRLPSATSAPDVEIDFGGAKDRLPKLLEPGSREVQIQAAAVASKNDNISVILDLLDVETGVRIDNRPLWVDGPKANVGRLAAENRELIARMLELAGKPTSGPVGTADTGARWTYIHRSAGRRYQLSDWPGLQYTHRRLFGWCRMMPTTFAEVALVVAARGHRPFPGHQHSKIPAMKAWPGLNLSPWDFQDLAAATRDYRPEENFCCCLAIPPEVVAYDLDIRDPDHAAAAAAIADGILGPTPLVRIGNAPKNIRIYRNAGGIR